jgi:hypothetical protein
MVRALSTVAVAVLLRSNVPLQDTTADDAAIYKAVIAHTIRSEVIRFGKGAGIETPTILVVDRTLAMCQPGKRLLVPLTCFSVDHIRRVEGPLRNSSMIFDGLITASARLELAKSL